MKAAEKSLLKAVRNRLRSEAGFSDKECDVEFDEMSPGVVGQRYIAVMPGGWIPGPRHRTSGGVNDLVYGVDVLVIKRITHIARDRRRQVFLDHLDALVEEIDKVYEQIDFQYTILDAANAIIEEETDSQEGFIEPLKFVGVDKRPRLAPAELFAGTTEQAAGLIRVISFHGARRITTK